MFGLSRHHDLSSALLRWCRTSAGRSGPPPLVHTWAARAGLGLGKGAWYPGPFVGVPFSLKLCPFLLKRKEERGLLRLCSPLSHWSLELMNENAVIRLELRSRIPIRSSQKGCDQWGKSFYITCACWLHPPQPFFVLPWLGFPSGFDHQPLTIISFCDHRDLLPFRPLPLPEMPLLDRGLGDIVSTPFSQHCEFLCQI